MTPTGAERPHRGTIFQETARILDHQDAGAGQWILRVQAPECAQRAAPGQFAHIQCSPNLPMRRPLSIQRVDREAGWVEFLYKVVGDGTQALSQQPVGDSLSVLGPIGVPFRLNPDRPLRLLLGGGVGIPPMIFLADHLRRQGEAGQTRAILGSEVPFPFRAKPSEILWPGLPDGAIATLPLLEDWGVACRLTSKAGIPGAHDGFVTDLARAWLKTLSPVERDQVELYACGPHPMLEACAELAAEFGLPCQVSLEEFMACAVGGCAGCTVPVRTPDGVAMKRVCVDGPVFAAADVFPEPARA
ncbi:MULTISPECIES: dihydroorotate dehydrogenase electron transfer subunit [unclassified Thioalkalivibrio]|uniref:dihydroorotate dehydrogenase electron transfer subunit n=1 Tax=unclassified Thioalkalivibrio TaxID=2621013 RepID=UPI0003676C97|nr:MULTISPECIES: dihydroorotate dehydrogenase electron transfer subunit [unclassified Thioalkalivibrio]